MHFFLKNGIPTFIRILNSVFIYFIFYINPLKIAIEHDNYDIFNYLLKLSEIQIRSKCFENCNKLKEINIPSSITSIGKHSFDGCINLNEISIPESVTTIDEYSFYNCVNLTNITLPSSITSIKKYTFANCKKLKTIIIPKSVISIRDYSFDECNSLEKVIITSSVTSIGKYVFRNCYSLVNLEMQSNIKYIDISAFENCNSLNKEAFPILKLCEKQYIEKIPYLTIPVFCDHGVGKSSFIESNYNIDFISNKIIINGNLVIFHLWESPRLDLNYITPVYYIKRQFYILIFDLSMPITFDHVKQHLDSRFRSEYNGITVLLGNKCDLEHLVKDEDINELVKEYNLKYFEISAKKDINVINVLEYIAEFAHEIQTKELNEQRANDGTNKMKCAIY